MAEDDNESRGAAGTRNLDDVLTALQKTFSRLSRDAAKVPEGQALALIDGPINFELKLRTDVDGDVLIQSSDGAIELSLEGTLTTDIRNVSEDDDEGDEK